VNLPPLGTEWHEFAVECASSTKACLICNRINTRQTFLIWLALIAWGLVGGALYGITGVLLADLFEVRVRYTGISLGYQMAGLLGGAPPPSIIATLLLHWARGATWSVATYLAASSLITVIAVSLVSGGHRGD